MPPPAHRRAVIIVLLCTASFSVTFCNMVMAPLIPSIKQDFGVSASIAAQAVSVYAFVAGTAGLLAGPLIDRIGRRPLLIAGMAVLGLGTVLTAAAPAVWALLAARAVAGVGAAVLMPGVVSAVADHFAYEERGRAISYTMSANTFSQIAGVPVGVAVAGLFSWRLAMLLLAALILMFTVLLALRLPPDAERQPTSVAGFRAIAGVIRERAAAGVVLSNVVAMVFWQMILTYLAVFFRDEHGFPTWALGATTMAMGTGVLIGANVGGRLSDRHGRRPLIVWGTLLAAPNIAVAITFAPNAAVSLAFIVLFAALTAMRFSSIQALATEINPAARGTMTSLFASGMQYAVVAGAMLGGVLLPAYGFGVLGVVCTAGYLASLPIFLLMVDQSWTVVGRAPAPREVLVPAEAE